MSTKREYYEETEDTFTSVTGSTWKAQAFTVGQISGDSYLLDGVYLYGAAAEAAGNLVIEIQTNSGADQPSGTVLATLTVAKANLLVDGWHVAIVPVPFAVSENDVLHLVAHVTAGTFYWRMRQTEPLYTRGGACTSGDGGVTWTGPAATADRKFQIWGSPLSSSSSSISSSSSSLSSSSSSSGGAESIPVFPTLGRAEAPGSPQQQMAADGTVHALLGEGSLAARADLTHRRSWTCAIHLLTLADYASFQTFYYTTVHRSVRAFWWTNRANGERVLVRFSPAAPPQWRPVENTKERWDLEFSLIEA